MAPKPLTDCPENLREAIDWLVQVKHCGGISTVSDALATLFENVAQDAEKSLPSLLDTDRPSARDVVSKLRAFQSTLPEDSENPNKNIIHNLCTSAGSLLGYRSPGTYDGSGIVYGNASRLCDAILAFLCAVFSDVHGNQPYVAGRDALYDDVIVPLKSQLWRGHKGFCQAIPKVANGLRDYNAAVKASNEKVKKPIETVLEYVKPDGELRKGINDLQITEASTPDEDAKTVESAVSLVERCKEVARVFSRSLTAAKEAIDDLNPKLKKRLENARRSFFNHVEWLSKWSKKGQKKRLEQMVQKIKTGLKQLANAVKDKIKQEVHTVVELLKDRVREIRIKLEGITASLEKYVKELGQWMDDAKKYIEDVKKYVDQIMQQLDGDHRKKIDRAAGEIDKTLSNKVGELNMWIEKAEAAVKAAKDKAEDVYGRLDKDEKSGTNISKGVKRIDEAKESVSGVNTQLEIVYNDLGNWKSAAQGVLRTAVERAEQVHDKLNPDQSGEDYPIGANIKNINDAKNEIDKANTALGKQVENLHKWIETAENIRQKAEEKAKEAYDKLDVHEALSQSVQKIVAAKNKIDEVNRNVTVQLGTLNQWNAEANKVLDGAIKNAEYVHERLKNVVVQKVEEIQQDNASIAAANKTLTTEIQNLDKWNTAAKEVIAKAENKCDEILKKVSKDHKENKNKDGPVILQEASKLKDQGTKLLKAATEAKQKVESKVAKALDAVKEMDADLKKDLKVVKDKIKAGITKVIEDLQVGKLGDKVKEDLQKLRKRIERLGKGLPQKGESNPLVQKALEELEGANKTITVETNKIKTETEKKLVDSFNENIKGPLNKGVEKVTEEIGKLYEKIYPQNGSVSEADKKNLHKIFEHINEQVAVIKGSAASGADYERATGLDGIVHHVRGLYDSFVQGHGTGVAVRVEGWIGSILGINKNTGGKPVKGMDAVTSWIRASYGEVRDRENALKAVKEQIKKALGEQIRTGQARISSRDRTDEIVHNLTKVKAACDKFVEELDKKLVKGEIEGFVRQIANQIRSPSGAAAAGEDAEHLKTAAVKAALIALCSCVRQIAIEIEFLGISMFGKKIDAIKQTVDGLHGKLVEATKTGNPDSGTAQAVDNAIERVSNEVKGLDTKFNQVKKPVDEAVKTLDAAVTQYDTKAKQQITEAAKKAIEQAAKQISDNGKAEIELKTKMPNFSREHDKIQKQLPNDLRALLDKHIGRDDTSDGKKDQVKLSRDFEKYDDHVRIGSLTDYVYGRLSLAIEQVRDEGLMEINELIGKRSGVGPAITSETFTGPFGNIERELNQIAELVSETKVDVRANR